MKGKQDNMAETILDAVSRDSKNIQTYAPYTEGWKVGGGLTLVDPITQIARRIRAFFQYDPDVITAYHINNQAVVEPGEDHVAELCIFVQCGKDVEDTAKADAISNFIRHRHVFTEYKMDGTVLRNHVLNVRVFAIGAIDPNDKEQVAKGDRISECPFIVDESKQTACNTLAKYEMLRIAFATNPYIARMQKYVAPVTGSIWYFIECSRNPVTFQEDNLTNITGYNSALAAEILGLVFVFAGDFQISTIAETKTNTLGYAFNW